MKELVSTKLNVLNLKKMDKKVARKIHSKQLALELAQMTLKHINRYVPRHSGKLRDKGYHITLGKNTVGAWFKIVYRNTAAVPYVLYQYYGEVYGPNYPTFERESLGEGFNKRDLMLRAAKFNYRHAGWSSSQKFEKQPTGRHFRRSRKKFQVKAGKYKGTWVTITGYTRNKKARPLWLEEAQKETTELNLLRLARTKRIEEVCREALEGT